MENETKPWNVSAKIPAQITSGALQLQDPLRVTPEVVPLWAPRFHLRGQSWTLYHVIDVYDVLYPSIVMVSYGKLW